MLFVVFTGDVVGVVLLSLAYADSFRAVDRTLGSEDSETIRKAIIDRAAELGAQLRA